VLKVSRWYQDHIGQFRDTPEFETERLLVDLTEELVAHMDRQDISRAELARRLGVSRAFVTNLLKGSPNLTIKTLVRVAYAAGLNIEISMQPKWLTNIRKYGFLIDATQPSVDLNEAHMDQLPDDVSALAA